MAGQPLAITLSLLGGQTKLLTTQPPPGPPPVPAASIASVVGTPITGSSAASPLTLVVPSVVANHALVVAVANGSGSSNPFTITDDKGNVWGTKLTDGWVSGGSFTRVELWAAFGVAAGTTTITCTSAGTNLQGIAMEVANITALDVASTAGSGIAAATTSDDQTPDILSTTADSFYVAAINGSTSGSVVFSHGNVGGSWTELVPPTVSTTGLRVGYRAVTGVGRRHDGWARSNGTAATGILTVAFKAVVPVDNRNAVLGITGGGVTVQIDTKGGQVVTPVTGGGDVLSAATKAAYLASGITGGGVVVAVDRKAAANATTITGGGDILQTDRKGGGASVTMTGGGDVLLSAPKGALLNVSMTGGGDVIISYTRSAGSSNANVIAQITGGGDITVPFKAGHNVAISISGGGVVTLTAPQSNAVLVVAFDMMEEGSGAGPTVRKPQGQAQFDDWTLEMDDNSIVELYALRKTR